MIMGYSMYLKIADMFITDNAMLFKYLRFLRERKKNTPYATGNNAICRWVPIGSKEQINAEASAPINTIIENTLVYGVPFNLIFVTARSFPAKVCW